MDVDFLAAELEDLAVNEGSYSHLVVIQWKLEGIHDTGHICNDGFHVAFNLSCIGHFVTLVRNALYFVVPRLPRVTVFEDSDYLFSFQLAEDFLGRGQSDLFR